MKAYYDDGQIQIYVGDCRDVLRQFDANTVDLVLTDPPYYQIASAAWDFQWASVEEWADWCTAWGQECCRVLKDNGSAYIFGDEKNIAYMQVRFDKLAWGLLNHIVWSKTNYTMLKADPDAMRSYRPQAEEHALFYGKDIRTFAEVVVPMSAAPMAAYIKAERQRAGLSKRDVAQHFPSRTGGLTGCVTNWEEGFNFPTADVYAKLRQILNSGGGEFLRREYEDLRREYEDLRREYEDLRRPFTGGQFTDVWSGPAISSTAKTHECEKPQWIVKRAINISTKPDGLMLDCFMGTGSAIVAAKHLGRRAIGIDINEGYAEIAVARLAQSVLPLEVS